MENIRNEKFAVDEAELMNVTGGTGDSMPAPRFPIGTPVLETEFIQEVGQDSGEVVAYGWYEDGKYSYIVRWRMKGERKYSEEEVEKLYRCWDLSR